MRRMRAIGLWATLAAVDALVALSVVGTFRGAVGARALFTSEPLAVFWILLAALLVACFFLGTGLVRSPGLVAMHVGSILVLLGAMWGSDKGHSVAEKLLGREKIPYGYMIITEGDSTDVLREKPEGIPPEQWPAPPQWEPIGRLPFRVRLNDFRIEDYPWELWFERPVGEGEPHGLVPMDWRVGEEMAVGTTALRVRVLRYLPFGRAVLDAEGQVVGAEVDPRSGRPAMEVEVTLRDRSLRRWIVVPAGEKFAGLPLSSLLPEAISEHAPIGLWLVRPRGMPKDFLSDLEILEGERVVAGKTIEVNHPLHWGGYHIYQADYDHEGEAYTVLAVRSDAGLNLVYAGFMLLVAGTFVRFWIERAWAGWRRERRDGAVPGAA